MVGAYHATKLPRICTRCDGAGVLVEKYRRFGSEIFIASAIRLPCEECSGRGTVWVEP